jgi:hypothetical protein
MVLSRDSIRGGSIRLGADIKDISGTTRVTETLVSVIAVVLRCRSS